LRRRRSHRTLRRRSDRTLRRRSDRTLRRRRWCTGACLCGPALLVLNDRIVLARRSRRPAGEALEDAGEVALVREPGLDRDLGEGPLLAEEFFRPPHATL